MNHELEELLGTSTAPKRAPRSNWYRGKYVGGKRKDVASAVYSFRELVAGYAESMGSSLEDAIAAVYAMLLQRSLDGDVKAASILLNRLCGKEAETVDLTVREDVPLTETERATRLQAILDNARRRVQAAEAN